MDIKSRIEKAKGSASDACYILVEREDEGGMLHAVREDELAAIRDACDEHLKGMSKA